MGYVEKRGKNSWRICVDVKVGGSWVPVRTTLRMDPDLPEAVQRRDAERELRNLEKRLAADQETAFTLRDWSEEWLRKVVAPDASPVTVHNYRHLLDSRILPALGGYALRDLTPAILTDWLLTVRAAPRKSTRLPEDQLARPRGKGERLAPPSRRDKPLSVNTVLHYYTCMVAMLSAAVRMGYLDHNPMERVQRPKLRAKKLRALTREDAVELIRRLDDAPTPGCRLAVLLALLCGLRLGEVCALQYDDVDWDRGTISVSKALKYTPDGGTFVAGPKSAAGDRTVTLPPSMLRILRDAMWDDVAEATDWPELWQGDRWIVHGKHGRRLHHDTPSKWFRDFADAHGYEGVRFHDLRHAHASILVADGIDVAAIASRMGHGDPGITLRTYTHAMPARDQAAAQTLDALLADPQAQPQPPSDPPPAAQANPQPPSQAPSPSDPQPAGQDQQPGQAKPQPSPAPAEPAKAQPDPPPRPAGGS